MEIHDSGTDNVEIDQLRISKILTEDLVIWKPDVTSRKGVFNLVSEALAGKIDVKSEDIFEKLTERERLGSTVIDDTGAALPHFRMKRIDTSVCAYVQLDKPIEYNNGTEIERLFVLLVPSQTTSIHLCQLSILSEFLIGDSSALALKDCDSSESAYRAILGWETENLPFFKYFLG